MISHIYFIHFFTYSLDDIHWLSQQGANGQIGMSIYTGRLSLIDCFMAQVNFNKSPLLPTIVQDVDSQKVLMLAYSNKESLTQALTQRKGIYFSQVFNILQERFKKLAGRGGSGN